MIATRCAAKSRRGTKPGLAGIPCGGTVEGLAHMDSFLFRRDGDGVEVDTRPPRGTVVPGVTVPGARDIERISSGQRSHLQGLGVAAHAVRSPPAHPCGPGRKSLRS